MEIWGGIESTINRVGDRFFDQLNYQGHYDRPADIDLLVSLGIKKVRYPILWEKHGNEFNKLIDWGVIGDNLDRLHKAGIEVIAGLVHHGSGPVYASIETDNFASGLALFAKAVATRFPWITLYTPINEPLTTARFCGLYGLWYPHNTTTPLFLQILLNECRATVLAMAAVREINPKAELVQTEDLGKIHSTPYLSYQADFENERRWLGIDLLCGKVNKDHALYSFLIVNGVSKADLDYFTANPCFPAILGFNYYLTSERYLDERISLYPKDLHVGGNNKQKYIDTEAIRSADVEISGLTQLLLEAWERYKLPLAVTEAHLFCGREDQLRWIKYVWDCVAKLKDHQVKVKGITIWSLFGAYGWDKLLTREKGTYESGAFDVSSGNPRPTAVAKMVSQLSQSQNYNHPVLEENGWWVRESRLRYPENKSQIACALLKTCQPILVIGASGTLGTAFTKVLGHRHIHAITLNRSQLNVTDLAQIETAIIQYKPWAIINATGFVDVDEAEIRKEDCFLGNTLGASNLAEKCQQNGIKLVTFSSDLVFDGEKNEDYVESDTVNPLNVYGWSKANAEEKVLATCEDALIIRTSAFFGPWDNYNFVSGIYTGLKSNKIMSIAEDVYISPTYVPDLVNATIDLLIDEEKGIWHLSNQGTLSWYNLAKEVAMRGKYNVNLLAPVSMAILGLRAQRPSFSGLRSSRGTLMPSVDNALERLFQTY